jgi:hypothetical protein
MTAVWVVLGLLGALMLLGLVVWLCGLGRPVEPVPDRVFRCVVKPHGDGSWRVWIDEPRYQGAATDGDLSRWKSPRDGTSASPRYVGRAHSRRRAERMANKALRQANSMARMRHQRGIEWRAASAREGFTVTTEATE